MYRTEIPHLINSGEITRGKAGMQWKKDIELGKANPITEKA